MAHSSKCTHFLPYYLAILYRNKSALASAKYRKPPADENVCPKGIILNKARPLSEKKKSPANEISGFSRRYSRWGAAGTDPTPVFGYATTGARRHPCASQPDHKFTVAAAAARFGFSLILSRYNRIFIVMRMVSLKFHHQEINMLDVSVA